MSMAICSFSEFISPGTSKFIFLIASSTANREYGKPRFLFNKRGKISLLNLPSRATEMAAAIVGSWSKLLFVAIFALIILPCLDCIKASYAYTCEYIKKKKKAPIPLEMFTPYHMCPFKISCYCVCKFRRLTINPIPSLELLSRFIYFIRENSIFIKHDWLCFVNQVPSF